MSARKRLSRDEIDEVFKGALAGDRRSLAQLLSVVEAGGEDFEFVAPKLLASSKGIHTIGLTGAPGAGKSTLTDALIGEALSMQRKVAVIAVDPSSPFTGGAILGDRVRLSDEHARDESVFVRSLASRGQLGGLSLAVPGMVAALDAAGWPIALVETVGVGQSEVAIAASADTTIVVVNPGWGDEVQANKAGLLEVADILVVNKSDRPGADATVRDLERMLHLGAARSWNPPIVKTIAAESKGADDLWKAINDHRAFMEKSGEWEARRRHRRVVELRERVSSELLRINSDIESNEGSDIARRVATGELDPATGAAQLRAMLGKRLRD